MASHPTTIMKRDSNKSARPRSPLDSAYVAAQFVITIAGAINRHFPGFMNRKKQNGIAMTEPSAINGVRRKTRPVNTHTSDNAMAGHPITNTGQWFNSRNMSKLFS